MAHAERRVFLQARELPGLALGALRGDAVSMRRILGARRGGRYGVAYAAVGAIAVVEPSLMGAFLVAAVVVTALAWALQRSATRLGLVPFVRLSLWIVAPALIVASLARLSEPESFAPGLFGLVVGHVLLWRNLRGGLA